MYVLYIIPKNEISIYDLNMYVHSSPTHNKNIPLKLAPLVSFKIENIFRLKPTADLEVSDG